jgi:hypothetical protein
MTHSHSIRRPIWRIPLLLAGATATGVAMALRDEPLARIFSWILMSMPVLTMIFKIVKNVTLRR